MASVIGPSLLWQKSLTLPARRTFAQQAVRKSIVLRLSTSTFRSQLLKPRPSPFKPSTLRSTPSNALKVAAFHASGRRPLLPPGPQVIDGTANDPAPVPTPSPTHGSYHWVFERLIAASLIPLTVAPFAAGTLNPVMDAILCGSILLHSHIGFQSIIIDYIPEKRFPKTRILFWWGLRLATLTVGVGMYEFETNDVGITEAIKRIWRA